MKRFKRHKESFGETLNQVALSVRFAANGEILGMIVSHQKAAHG
jgi:hypothetical protein